MSAKLNALTSDSYTDISQYRDQHFKVSFFFYPHFWQSSSGNRAAHKVDFVWDDIVFSFRQQSSMFTLHIYFGLKE